MFAQLLITLATVWIIAEVLCRWILGLSVAAAARDLFGLAAEEPADLVTVNGASVPGDVPGATVPAVEPNATLRQLLGDRQRQLDETGDRLELTAQTADVSEQLALREAELAVTEGRLAELEKRRTAGARE